MSDLHWGKGISNITPYVFRVRTPGGHGSGWLLTTRKTGVCGVATAWHVVAHAEEWEQPIKLHHYGSGREIVVNAGNRAIYRRLDRDVALILFTPRDLELPKTDLQLSPKGYYLMQGLSLGWVGFPSVASATLCFFEGKVSAHINDNDSYLVDGVAINGVSGGPAFRVDPNESIHMLGCVSAYIPNRSTGESLPGLCVVQDISPFYAFLDQIKSVEDAQNKVADIEQPSPESPS